MIQLRPLWPLVLILPFAILFGSKVYYEYGLCVKEIQLWNNRTRAPTCVFTEENKGWTRVLAACEEAFELADKNSFVCLYDKAYAYLMTPVAYLKEVYGVTWLVNVGTGVVFIIAIGAAFSLQAYVRAGWEYNAIAYRVDVERKQHSAELSVRQMEINSHTQLLAEWKNERAGIQAPTQHPRITEL